MGRGSFVQVIGVRIRREERSAVIAGSGQSLYTCSLLDWWGNTGDYFCRYDDATVVATIYTRHGSHVHYSARRKPIFRGHANLSHVSFNNLLMNLSWNTYNIIGAYRTIFTFFYNIFYNINRLHKRESLLVRNVYIYNLHT